MVAETSWYLIWVTLGLLLVKVCLCAPHEVLSCSQCPPGYGVLTRCSPIQDTVCQPCAQGTYSRHHSSRHPCYPCSRCGSDLFELHPCNATHDVFCETCSWTKTPYNKNYIQVCLKNKYGTQMRDTRFKDEWVLMQSDGVVPEENMAEDTAADKDALEDKNQVKNESSSNDNSSQKDMHNNNQINMTEEMQEVNSTLANKNMNNTFSKVEDENMNNTGSTVETMIKKTTANEDYQSDVKMDDTIMYNNTSSESEWNNIVSGENIVLNGDGQELLEDTSIPPEFGGEGWFEANGGSGSGESHQPALVLKDDSSGSGSGEGSGEFDWFTEPDQKDVTTAAGVVPVKPEETSKPQPKDTDVPQIKHLEEPIDKTHKMKPPENEVNEIEMKSGASSELTEEKKKISGLALGMAILTSGVIFFFVGYFYNSKKKATHSYTPSHIYDYERSSTVPIRGKSYELSHFGGKDRGGTPYEMAPQLVITDEGESDKNEKSDEDDQSSDLESDVFNVTSPPPPIGQYQSPVDIDPESAEHDEVLEKNGLVIKYVPENSRTITNTGTTVKVAIDCRGSSLSGGPLGDGRFCLDHFHFHWGSRNSQGSEHTIQGQAYAAELHLVHWNHDKYNSFAHAAKSDGGLAVIAVLLKIGEENHEGLSLLCNCLPSIKYKGESREIPNGFYDPTRLLPDNTADYWTYSGSLTTPPYYETVTWIVFKEAIEISQEQLNRFRSLVTFERDEAHGRDEYYYTLVDNYRKTMPLQDRIISASFL